MSKRFLSCARLFILSMFLFLPTILHAEIFLQDDFESGNLNGWSWITNTTDGCYSANQIVSTTEDKFSGIYSVKFINHIGDMCTYMQSNQGFLRKVGQGENLYVRFRLKFSTNHEWTSENKTVSIFGNSVFAPQPRVHYNLTRRNDGGPIPVPASLHQAMPQLLVRTNKEAYNNGWRPANSPDGDIFVQNIDTANPVYISTGQWYTIEIYIRPDATGNGFVKMWINGKLIMEHNNLYTLTSGRTTDAYGNFIVGGTFNQDPEGNYIQTESTHYFDDILVSDTCNSCDEPSAQIINPTNSNTYTTTNTTINLSGTAIDTLGTNIGVTSITWSNNRGGSGTASGSTNWSVSNVPLQSGQNIITVTATDGDGKTGTDILIVNPTTSSGGNNNLSTNSTGGDTEVSGSGCGFVKDDDNGNGPRAKGEGLSLMIMLIITLVGIAVARRIQVKKRMVLS